MQQTEKYQLNLIETSDPFSPEALNQNTQKVENALIAHAAAVEEVTDELAEQTAGLDTRVTALEVHKMVAGKYTGNRDTVDYTPQFINLGFTPAALVVGYNGAHIVTGQWGDPMVSIVEGGFRVQNTGGAGLNRGSTTYMYVAFV